MRKALFFNDVLEHPGDYPANGVPENPGRLEESRKPPIKSAIPDRLKVKHRLPWKLNL